MENLIEKAAAKLANSKHAVAFTGAGISVESGIPPFRGENGLWQSYNPIILDLDFFHNNAEEAWHAIKKLFYDFFGKAKPNAAHIAMAQLEKQGIIKSLITQNIDNLHQEAGSKCVHEFHGTAQTMVCLKCNNKYNSKDVDLQTLPPLCSNCNSVLKPDFIFFGEGIPSEVNRISFEEAANCDLMLVVGTTGEVMPASMLPDVAKGNGATIIEINPNPSNFTNKVTDIFLPQKASIAMQSIIDCLNNK